jgi:F420-non-reducing hydrogenase iron-sulfur subunit
MPETTGTTGTGGTAGTAAAIRGSGPAAAATAAAAGGSGPAAAAGVDARKLRIVCFFCNWCTYLAADLAGTSRIKYPANARVIRVMCSGRVDPQFVLDAFARGADAVLVGGCHPGDCHYQEGNAKALRRYRLLKRVVEGLGIDPRRFRLEWISASEADKLRCVLSEMLDDLRILGPLRAEVPPERFDGDGAGSPREEVALR